MGITSGRERRKKMISKENEREKREKKEKEENIGQNIETRQKIVF